MSKRLPHRGDDHVLSAYIEHEIEQEMALQMHSSVIEQLALFDREKVRNALRTKLKDEPDDESRRVILDLIGHFGDNSDIVELNRLIESQSDLIANAAFEAKLRLTDPLRLAENW